ncbi:MAG TPA: NAD(+)/NADH kinase, partial [Pseudonocardiaceae bacterium]|nr:NAD(+)/NADH kinase [Pseudonocardiaceae bacterium]
MGLIGSIGFVLHPRRNCAPALDTVVDWARERDITVLGLRGESDRTNGSVVAVDASELGPRVDLLVSLVGDGTMLRAMR